MLIPQDVARPWDVNIQYNYEHPVTCATNEKSLLIYIYLAYSTQYDMKLINNELTITIRQNSIERCEESIHFFFVESWKVTEILHHCKLTNRFGSRILNLVHDWSKSLIICKTYSSPQQSKNSNWKSILYMKQFYTSLMTCCVSQVSELLS